MPACCACGDAAAARGPVCAGCRAGLLPAAGAAAWRYEGAARSLVLLAKEQADGPAAHALRALLREPLAALPPCDLVTWPPPSRRRRLAGWYLPRFLAVAAARARGVPARALLRRVGDPPAQAGLDGAARRRNLRGRFRARSRVPARVLLLDDVTTTGATFAEAERALRGAGAREVHAFAAARADEAGPWA